MSSLKMTFSLASLILIFAFVAIPVMAHDNASSDTTTPREHRHPLTEALGAQTDAAGPTPGTAVPAHDTHPTVMSIVAKPDASGATLQTSDGREVILLDAAGTAALAIDGTGGVGQFIVRVTFSGTLASDAELAAGEVTIRARYANGSPVTAALTVGTVVGDAGQNVFDVPINVPQDAYWDSTATPAASVLPIEVFVDIDRNAVATGTTIDANGVTLSPAASDEYMSNLNTKFTVVDALTPNTVPTLAIDTNAPTNAQTGSFDIEYTTDDAEMDSVTVAATHTVSPSSAMAHYTLDTSVDGTVTVTQAMPTATMMEVPAASVTVTLTPSDAVSGDGEAQTFTVAFAAATYTAPTPNQRPTAMISTAAPPAAQTGSFDIVYTTADAEGDSVTVAVNYSVSPASARAHYTVADSASGGTVTVTQATPDANMMTIPAATVTVTITPSDTSGAGDAVMLSVAFATATYTAPNMRPTATISTTEPEDAVTTGSFDIVYTTADADMDTVTVAVTHEVSPSGAMTHYTLDTSVDGTVTVTQATPDANMMTIPAATVTVTITPSDSAAGTGVMLSVAFAAATYVDPSANMLKAGGYLVFVPENHNASALPQGLATETVEMPDLSAHFTTGGTIDVAVADKDNHDVIITEIMVAKDLGRVGQVGMMRPEAGQWIELYNNTDAAISIDDISITFATGFPAVAAPMDATDRFSNVVSPGGWSFADTFGDALSGETAENASGVHVVTKPFKSLRRSYKKNANDYDDSKRLQDAGTVVGNGWDTRSWKLTADSRVFLAGRIGTPGSENRPTVFTPAVFTAPKMNVTINEVANRADATNEWIELKGPAGTNMKKYKLSIVTGYDKNNNTGTESTIYQFPDNDDTKMPAGGLLLLTDQDPANNELAADLEDGVPKPMRYKIVTLAELPDDGNFLLVLRNTGGAIEDVAGHLAGLDDDDPYTTLWPLKANVGRISAKNKLAGGNVYKRARAIQGYSSNKDNGDEPAFEGAGFTGIGYDRLVNAGNKEHHGTPGYPNGSQIGDGAGATDNIIISEVMYGDGEGRNAQWIELHNQSATNGVDLHNWKLYIVNHNENADGTTFGGELLADFFLRNVKIPPKQTALIVSKAGRHTTNLPAHRILNIRRTPDNPMLSSKGFYLRLVAKAHEADSSKHQPGDIVGNLVAPATARRNTGQQAFMEPVWALPEGVAAGGERVSIERRPPNTNGTKAGGWSSSADSTRSYNAQTYYGRPSDIGTPGHTAGGVLPVSLSKFRPERLESGAIVVRWITESELNNAGFNILRSETRNGEFTKVHFRAGQGTTTERNVYEWTDKSAKPNVVYYYQIQDVSLDGEVTTLRQSRLKGDVSAAGKLTTTWGELKALQ